MSPIQKSDIAFKNETKEQKIGKNFEEIFLRNCLEIMSKGLSSDPLLGGGFAENMYRSFLDEAIAKKITDGGGIGVASLIAQELITLQRRTY